MTHNSLFSIDGYRKLNAKRLLTLGIIGMLTLLAVMAVEPVSASPEEPWWFLPSKWRYETGTGSNRTMVICTSLVDSSIPSPSVIDTTGKVSFSLDISAPNASGLATITVPEASINITRFYIKDVFGLVFLWGELYATGDGNGTLATVDNVLDVDVYSEVIGYGNGTYAGTTIKQIGDGTPDPAGSALVYLPLELHIWSGHNDTDPTPTTPDAINMTTPFPIYVTTGFTITTIVDSTPYPSGSVSMDGEQINGTGVPADADTGVFTCVATGGGLDLYESLLGLYSDYLFKEVMVVTPSPPIPSEPITSITALPTTVFQGDTVDINVTVENGLDYSATVNITVYADDTVIETRTGVTVGANAGTTITVTWDTTGVSLGTYTITAEFYGKIVIDIKTYTFHDSHLGPSVSVNETVIPEFPPSLFAPLLMITTIAATLLGKIVWSRKRRNLPTAQVK